MCQLCAKVSSSVNGSRVSLSVKLFFRWYCHITTIKTTAHCIISIVVYRHINQLRWAVAFTVESNHLIPKANRVHKISLDLTTIRLCEPCLCTSRSSLEPLPLAFSTILVLFYRKKITGQLGVFIIIIFISSFFSCFILFSCFCLILLLVISLTVMFSFYNHWLLSMLRIWKKHRGHVDDGLSPPQ